MNISKVIHSLGKTVSKCVPIKRTAQTTASCPISPTFTPSLTRTNTSYLERIKRIPVVGIKETEKPILDIIKTTMYDLLAKTKGQAALPKEIQFARVLKNGKANPQGVACVTRENILYVNRDYIKNIDKNIQFDIDRFIELGFLKRNKGGKYVIADFLRNPKSEIFETRLNQYSKNWPLDYKFKLHRASMNYFANLTYQSRHCPHIMLENIMKTGENQNILKQCGLFKSKEDILKLPREKQFAYLQEIFEKTKAQGKELIFPVDTALITTPNYVFTHELGHVNHNMLTSKNEYLSLVSPETAQKWANNPAIYEICTRVTGYATTHPIEFVAEVFAGLANGQKFHPDVMKLYEKLKGPLIF